VDDAHRKYRYRAQHAQRAPPECEVPVTRAEVRYNGITYAASAPMRRLSSPKIENRVKYTKIAPQNRAKHVYF
jgi:hypothetical protein